MTDPHQINSIISAAILSCKADTDDQEMDVEKAKHMAKRIVAALTEAGLDIVLKDSTGSLPT
jgi:histidinol-phosphate/aromatic aminotransferase/cobyric acid decarboxylase-like protein